MCEPVTTGLLLSAIGGGVKAINAQSALRKQDADIAKGIKQQSVTQREANSRVNEQIKKIGGDTGEEQRAASLAAYQDALRRGRSSTEGALNPIAGANSRYAEDVAGGAAKLKAEGATAADQLSVLSGALRQRAQEGQSLGRLGIDLNALKTKAGMQDYLAHLRAASHTPNPWVDLGGDVLSGYGAGKVLRVPPLTDSGNLITPLTGVTRTLRQYYPLAGTP